MATLYDIDERLASIFITEDGTAVDENTGEILDAAALDAIQMERAEKIDNIMCYIKNLRSDAESYKAEADRLAKRYKAATNKANYLIEYLAAHMEEGKKFSNAHGEIGWRKTVSVDVPDVMKLPEEYRKAEWKPDKKALSAVLKKGEVIPGASLLEKMKMQVK